LWTFYTVKLTTGLHQSQILRIGGVLPPLKGAVLNNSENFTLRMCGASPLHKGSVLNNRDNFKFFISIVNQQKTKSLTKVLTVINVRGKNKYIIKWADKAKLRSNLF
jgi:hypothetical protein